MPPNTPLFTLPISPSNPPTPAAGTKTYPPPTPPPTPSQPPFTPSNPPTPAAGTITCTQPSPRVYLLTFTSPPDNRLTPPFCGTLMLALDILEHRYPKGVVVTTSGIEKFYSNGLDYESAVRTEGFWGEVLYPLWRRLLTYPMPTLALLNGHAFAGGLMTAMHHDYRIQNPHRGYLCLNELDFGAPLLPPMASIFRQKLPSPNTYRTMVLESKRFGALEALREGIVDGLGGVAEAVAFCGEYGLVEKGKSGVYGRLKAEMWGESVALLEGWEGWVGRERGEREREGERGREQVRRVEEWERRCGVRAKL